MSLARVLLVDDEPQVLAALRRTLRGRYELETTDQPLQALALLRDRGPFAVLVSDMRMPGLDGAQLLTRARSQAPDTTRVMLTGNADQLTAARAVNEGSIFRFLNKPCGGEELVSVLDAAVEHHHHLRDERELLEHTLQGALGALTEVLALTDPEAFGRATRLRDHARELARAAGSDKVWEIELAALMLQLGRVSVPPEVRHKQSLGEELTHEERRMLDRVPEVGAGLLARIPRLEGVVAILNALAPQAPTLASTPGARLLVPLLGIAELEEAGHRRDDSWARVRAAAEPEPEVREALERWVALDPHGDAQREQGSRRVLFSELRPGMVLAEPLLMHDGRTLLGAGQLISAILFERIRNHAHLHGVKEPVTIRTGGMQPAPTTLEGT
ncbi:MAG: response regulator [Planctomycetes bacterium]|nr:response regulator [Planctomycetota bacterium]